MNFSTLVDLLQHRSQYQPEDKTYTYLQDGETQTMTFTYQELDRKARAIAAYLQSVNAPGERVLLLYPPGLEFIAGFFGCLYANAIAIPAYLPRPEQSLDFLHKIANDAETKVAFTTTSILPYLKARFATVPKLAAMQLVATNNIAEELAENWQQPKLNRDTLAFLQYTSGSTGTPKGVMISHGNVMHNLAMSEAGSDFSEHSRTVTWLPFGHNTGMLTGVLQPFFSNFPVTIMSPLDFLQKPLRWLLAISRYRGTQSLAPNFAYDLVCFKTTPEERATLDLSCWDLAACGAEPVRTETIERFSQIFAACGFRSSAFTVGYGMSENVVGISLGLKTEPPCILHLDKAALEKNQVLVTDSDGDNSKTMVSCGRTNLDQKIVIVNPETLTECSPEQIGEIWVSSPSVAQGYWQKPQATKETFEAYVADTNQGPFLRSGDLGFYRDGELFVIGRLKELIIIRGRNHYPQDIELTVENSHPALRSSCCAAFSVEVDNEERLVITQEIEQAFLEELNVNEVFAAIRQAVFQEYALQVYGILLLNPGTIPKTLSNKIQRRACQTGFLNGSLNTFASNISQTANLTTQQEYFDCKILLEASPEQRQALLKSYLQNSISRILKLEPSQIDWQQPFTTMGLDSLMAVELNNVIEASLGCSLSSTLILDYPTLNTLVDYLMAEVATPSTSDRLEVKSPSSSLVTLQSGGSQPAFFCVPGSVGTPFYLHSLAQCLGSDQPFYGLEARGVDGKVEPNTQIEEIAADYIAAIQTIQPQGPYFLGGHSFGGKVAFEMSQQLQKQGHDIGLLAIFDIPAPLPNQEIRVELDETQSMVEIAALFARLRGKNLQIPHTSLAALAPEEQVNYVIEQLQINNIMPAELAKPQLRGIVKVLQANLKAMANYAPQEIHPTRIAFFRAGELNSWDAATWLPESIHQQANYGWDKIAIASLDTFVVPGDHVTMMVEPYVQNLAKHLKVCLSKAQATVSAI